MVTGEGVLPVQGLGEVSEGFQGGEQEGVLWPGFPISWVVYFHTEALHQSGCPQQEAHGGMGWGRGNLGQGFPGMPLGHIGG